MCPVRSVTYVSGRSRCEPDVVVADLAAWGLQIRVQAIWAKQHFALDKRTIRVSAIPRGPLVASIAPIGGEDRGEAADRRRPSVDWWSPNRRRLESR